MQNVVGLMLNFVLAFLFVFILSTSFYAFFRKNSERNFVQSGDWIDYLCQSFLFSLVLVSLISYNLPKFEHNPGRFLELLGLGLTFLSLLGNLSRKKINLMGSLPLLMLAPLAGIWNLIPGIMVLSQNGLYFGLVSLFNNDISNYTGLATEVLDNGFVNNGHYFAYNLNKFAELYAYQTPIGIIEFVSSTTHLAAWQVAMPVMIIATAYFAISIFRLVKILFPKLQNVQYYLVAFLIPIFPIFGYISANYFLGQVIAGAIILQIISINLQFRSQKSLSKTLALEFFGLLVLSIYAYPHILIFIYFLALAINLSTMIAHKSTSASTILKLTSSLAFAVIVSISYLPQSLWLIHAQSAATAGWPLPIFNPLSLFVFPGLLNKPFGLFLTLGAWIVFIIICTFLLKGKGIPVSKEEKNISIFMASITFVIWILVLILRGRSLTEYSSWKLFTYFLPIILCLVLPMVLSNHRLGKNIQYMLLGLAITFPLSTWEPYYKNQLFTSASFVNAVQSKKIEHLHNLNIDLGHFFESMNAAMIIRGPKIYLVAPTYYNKSFNPKACTLVWNTNKSHGSVIPINQSYGLALGGNTNCV